MASVCVHFSEALTPGLRTARHISCELKVHVYHGHGTGIDRDTIAEQDIVFTTYETIASDVKQSHKLQAISWFRVVLDEGENCPLQAYSQICS